MPLDILAWELSTPGTGEYESAVGQFKLAADLQPTDDVAYKSCFSVRATERTYTS